MRVVLVAPSRNQAPIASAVRRRICTVPAVSAPRGVTTGTTGPRIPVSSRSSTATASAPKLLASEERPIAPEHQWLPQPPRRAHRRGLLDTHAYTKSRLDQGGPG